MLFTVARLLQLLGLIILPLSIMYELSGQVSLKNSLVYSAVGMGLFFLGWLLQKNTKSE